MTATVQAIAAVLIVLGTGTLSAMQIGAGVPEPAVAEGPWQESHVLDGRQFRVVQTSAETGPQDNALSFADGKFLSATCEGYCKRGWTGYRAWVEGDVIRFTATTRCPDAPHVMVWQGVVTGDRIELSATWTARRWYWTRQIAMTGHGTAIRSADGGRNG